MKVNKQLAVVIPCYKVAKQIEEVIAGIPDFIDYIIVVDDACPESSGKLVEGFQFERVQVVYHQKNQGVGGAVASGFKKALELQCDIAIKMDGDGQMNPNHIEALVEPLLQGCADYTKGNRFQDFQALKSMPRTRLFGNSVLSFIIKSASGYWDLMDPSNGFCAITAQALKRINLDKLEKRYFFETDMLIHLNINGQVVQDVPMPAIYGDEVSNLSIKHTILVFPPKIIKGFFKRIFLKYYIYNFNMASIYLLLGIPLLLFGFSFGIYRWIAGYLENQLNSAGTIMLVALPIIIGIQFLLQAIQIDINNIPKKAFNRFS